MVGKTGALRYLIFYLEDEVRCRSNPSSSKPAAIISRRSSRWTVSLIRSPSIISACRRSPMSCGRRASACCSPATRVFSAKPLSKPPRNGQPVRCSCTTPFRWPTDNRAVCTATGGRLAKQREQQAQKLVLTHHAQRALDDQDAILADLGRILTGRWNLRIVCPVLR